MIQPETMQQLHNLQDEAFQTLKVLYGCKDKDDKAFAFGLLMGAGITYAVFRTNVVQTTISNLATAVPAAMGEIAKGLGQAGPESLGVGI